MRRQRKTTHGGRWRRPSPDSARHRWPKRGFYPQQRNRLVRGLRQTAKTFEAMSEALRGAVDAALYLRAALTNGRHAA